MNRKIVLILMSLGVLMGALTGCNKKEETKQPIPIVSGNVHYMDESDSENIEDVVKTDKELGAFLKEDEYKGEMMWNMEKIG